ncbi:hypothetical protein BSIN_2526 [Burkholderia singularis]|uniref:Uncharacterized protein n=1 Tax=Burkholderia singularis TaxID=1503053 RepID=A0A238H2K4_9BURK|nr:hypothetical protein BSIN_2526 [Burkholderia singularis]
MREAPAPQPDQRQRRITRLARMRRFCVGCARADAQAQDRDSMRNRSGPLLWWRGVRICRVQSAAS